MKLWFNKIKDSFSFQEKFFCFAVFGGLLCVKNNCASICWVNKNGNLGLVSSKSVKPLIKHQNFFLWRGIEFVVYGTYYQIKALFFSAKHQDILPKIKQRDFSKFCKAMLQIGFVLGFVVIVILANWLLLGIFPAKLCFWIMGDVENLFMARLLIGLIKCVLLFLLFLVCKLLTSVKSVWKVFTASTALLYNQNMYPLNFYNVIFGALLLDVFVVSLCGLNLAMVSGFLVSVLILLVCSGLSFEICLWQSMSKSFFAKAYKLIGLLFYELPNKTEMQIAVGAITECELMIKNEEREGLADFESEQEIPLAFVLGDVRVSLKKAGIIEESEAEWLIAGVLGLKRFDLKFVKTLTHKQLNLVQMVLERRINFEPLDKIFGFKEFMGLKFYVNKNVLSPRPETELLVEEALKALPQKAKVLDLCTGSGAIGISIAKFTDAEVLAVDISEEALDVAKRNAQENDVAIKFKQSNLFDKVTKKFNMIISNPPYIKTEEIAHLDKEVKNFDPIISLDGGSDGLYFYRKIATESARYLTKNGKILLEVGAGQAQKVKKMLTENFKNIKIIKDYSGVQRILYAEKKE